jgi:lysozyme
MPLAKTVVDFVVPLLKKHEGERLRVYLDSLGIRTIGVGFNLEQIGARMIISRLGADFDALIFGRCELTQKQCDDLLLFSIDETYDWLGHVFSEFDTYSVQRQAALIDMGFMGKGHFAGFHRLIADVQSGDWPAVGQEELASKWAVQVGSRAHDDLLLLTQV